MVQTGNRKSTSTHQPSITSVDYQILAVSALEPLALVRGWAVRPGDDVERTQLVPADPAHTCA